MAGRSLKGELLFFLMFLMLSSLLSGRSNDPVSPADLPFYLARFPNDPFVYLEKEEYVTMRPGKGELKIARHHKERLMILKNGYNSVRRRKIHSSFFVQVTNVKATLYRVKKNTYEREQIKDIQVRTESNDNDIFYSSDKYYLVEFSSANAGDLVCIEYDETYTDPHVFGSFYVSDYVPVIKSICTVKYPNGSLLFRHKLHNNQQVDGQMRIDSSKKDVTYRWQYDTVQALREEPFEPSFKHKATFILMAVENMVSEDSTIPIAGTVQNLYSWYHGLLKNVDAQGTEEIKKLTDSICAGDSSELGQLEKIYYWVQEKIAYLAYEDGLGGVVPRAAKLVCDRKFGDCKDMANVIVQMARCRNLPVYPAWIGTRDISHQLSDFPGSFCFNHLIAVYMGKSDTIFLDGTGKYHHFKMPTAMIQGKEAMVGVDDNSYVILTVPWMAADQSTEHDSVSLTILPDLSLHGKGYWTLTGYDKVRIARILEPKSYGEQFEYLKSALEKGNNKFKLDTFTIAHGERDGQMLISYQFILRDHVSSYKDTFFLGINFLSRFFDRIELQKRRYPISFNYRSITRLTVSMETGDQFTVAHLPEAQHYAATPAAFSYNYLSTPQHIVFRNEIAINNALVADEDIGRLGKVITAYRRNKSDIVSLSANKKSP